MDFIDIIPAVRMLLSKEQLVLCKGLPSTPQAKYESLEDLQNAGLRVKSSDCINVANVDSWEAIKAGIDASENKSPKVIVIKGLGSILIRQNEVKPMESVVQGRIVIVTGGAQGFGGGVAEELYAKGAHIVIADLNEEVGSQMVAKLNALGYSNKAIFVNVNVGDSGSVNKLIEQTVLQLGGVDAIVSNAGILRAGGLDEMDPDTFDLMTKVNYAGYFYCAKHASRIMKIQASVKPDHFMDIIQINSKSGLKGSNRNFAYAGGKFGGIGLTQSFALELMPHRIKVNSICPGNFFDGPLWSDPEKGLFVQYLQAGKVPGAKTVEDVQAFYEKQVPAGRGCRVNDVTKAIMYVIDQDYETGQAIPVTGGQEMLN